MLRISTQTTSVITYAEIKIQQALVSPRNGNSHRVKTFSIVPRTEKRLQGRKMLLHTNEPYDPLQKKPINQESRFKADSA